MATLVREPAPPAPPVGPTEPRTATLQTDAWPHTKRPMPWLVAVFMVMVYLLPFDSTSIPLRLPFNSGLDRLVLIVIALVWVGVCITSRRPPLASHSAINIAVLVFIVLGTFSLVHNLRDLAWDGELGPSFKQLLLAITYFLFFYIVSSSLTREDVIPFIKLLVVLGVISGLGTLLEFRSHHNYFVEIARHIPGAKVRMREIVAGGKNRFARHSYSGPTKHGLADATMLDAGIPFAMVFLRRARTAWDGIKWGFALLVLVAACVATQEKTALILLVASIVVMVAIHPRRYARWWPLLIVAIPVVRIAAPHSISALRYQFKDVASSNSTSGRTSDYSAVAPFINTHLLFGRGFGSYSPTKYRILDDQMLQFVIDTGVLGFFSYCALIAAPALIVWRRARRGITLIDDLLGGMIAGCVAFFLSNFLYDSFSFRQGPYVFFLLAGFTAAAVGRRGPPPVNEPPVATRPA